MTQLTTTEVSLRTKILKASIWAALLGVLVVFGDEIILAGPIIFLTWAFGLVLGGIVFALVWFILGVLGLELVTRKGWLKGFFDSSPFTKMSLERGKLKWRDRLVLWAANIARTFGGLVAAVVLGPVLGWPAFKWLGYQKQGVYAWTALAAPIFALIWVPFYGGIGFLIFKLF